MLLAPWLNKDANRDRSNGLLGAAERADHDVIPVRITERKFYSSGTGVQVGLFLQFNHKIARSTQGFIKIIYSKEQKQPIARLGALRRSQRRMFVSTPLMEAK